MVHTVHEYAQNTSHTLTERDTEAKSRSLALFRGCVNEQIEYAENRPASSQSKQNKGVRGLDDHLDTVGTPQHHGILFTVRESTKITEKHPTAETADCT